ncbi:glycoside hydrolase family 15 protein [Nocardia sp. AG03]|uniref:glycoside hydrolase family 15 protein n=1 Tax=Nocardia sp. AG03 TaxID=3025312 RepID=UPI0024181632|nr:glycoside hydrolase family 15 protein [Nocardia sp. AG03]
MNEYPPIDEHGIVGDLQTAALVSSDATIDWWCAPRFDAPSVFASLLDSEKGGYCAVAIDTSHTVTVRQLYLPDTAILLTRFSGPDGVGEVADFMEPLVGDAPADRHRLVRVIRVVRGTLTFTLSCRPRFDYGRATHTLGLVDDHAAVFDSPVAALHLETSAQITVRADGTDTVSDFTLTAGEVAGVVLTTAPPGAELSERSTYDSVRAAFDRCRRYWQTWLRTSTYRGRWRDMVNRSAITLKLLTYAPTGAPIAAATMGLPEQIGGERNWDYRYTWIRDASLSVRALRDLGFTEEAHAFRRWLRDRVGAGGTASGEPLQIMYRVDGDPKLTEETLDHLSGYRDSAPVRLGNGAADQIQLDIYGEAADALAQATGIAGITGWKMFAGLVDWLADNWDRPDEGIWETRGGRQNFTFSRLMTWVAFDRAIRLATDEGRPADLIRWRTERDAVFEQIVERGYDTERQAFVQHFDTHVLDASLLLMPRMGFLAASDPMWTSTMDAMERELVSDSLVYRYDPEASPDGLRGTEGTFNMCSFLYVEALARAGRVQQARYAFEKMLTYANHVGLFAEEIGPSGEQLGNFPQAFTHLALIAAAQALDEELDRAESTP